MRHLTLISDWYQNDNYVGMLKGLICSNCPNLSIIDISHNVNQFSVDRAAYQLKHSYHYFPQGTIHLVMVNSEIVKRAQFLFFEKNSHYFLLPDNGIVSLLFNELPEKVFSLKYEITSSFNSLECVLEVLKKMNDNIEFEQFALPTSEFETKTMLMPTWEDNIIVGNIIYIDSYYNAICNISNELFDQIGKGRPYEIYVQSYHNRVTELSTTYNQVLPGELLALFNSAQLLEFAIRNGFAAQLLNLNIGSEVKVRFLPFKQDILLM